MPDASIPDLPHVSLATDERTTLVEYLEYYRAVFRKKAAGLDHGQLQAALFPSDLTLSGLVHHMALVEDGWFSECLSDQPVEPWASVDWVANPDWELRTASELSVVELFDQYDASVARSRLSLDSWLSLDELALAARPQGERPSVRWILVHMVEEYARHCGHANFLRQAVDGVTGD